MKMNRRRFLAISAASVLASSPAHARTWTGRAFGAEASITLSGDHSQTGRTLVRCRDIISRVEACFSLHDPSSEIRRLNEAGALHNPSADMQELLAATDHLYAATGGLFDPSMQTLWEAIASRRPARPTLLHNSWESASWSSEKVALSPGQRLSFNGLAQGYATDLVSEQLQRDGFGEVLVNIGEFRATGGTWRIGVADPAAGLLGHQTLRRDAMATSSPAATTVGGHSHIMHANRIPLWSTVSVVARSGLMADGLSTALTLATREEIERIAHRLPGIRSVLVVDENGLERLV